MSMNDEQRQEQKLQELGLDAARITPSMVDDAIKSDEYTVLQDGRTTVCLLTLDNGFTIRGESACVSKANFNEHFGQQAAYEDARRKVWAFLAFRLADKIAFGG